MTSILGISAFYHDSAAAIIIDGKIIAAAQEERFTRVKHDSSYPYNAIEFVLDFSKLINCNLINRLTSHSDMCSQQDASCKSDHCVRSNQ